MRCRSLPAAGISKIANPKKTRNDSGAAAVSGHIWRGRRGHYQDSDSGRRLHGPHIEEKECRIEMAKRKDCRGVASVEEDETKMSRRGHEQPPERKTRAGSPSRSMRHRTVKS
ncbi:hypothetical protein K438DRAFT_474771 [Mycena galopus ATCC 62051]|nr:hypothetical protein K438DRAFT_474771 [Mycena galopus ATCC 62051]